MSEDGQLLIVPPTAIAPRPRPDEIPLLRFDILLYSLDFSAFYLKKLRGKGLFSLSCKIKRATVRGREAMCRAVVFSALTHYTRQIEFYVTDLMLTTLWHFNR